MPIALARYNPPVAIAISDFSVPTHKITNIDENAIPVPKPLRTIYKLSSQEVFPFYLTISRKQQSEVESMPRRVKSLYLPVF
jgi:hypothetical protein